MRDRQKESYRGKSPAMQRVEKMRKKRVQRERMMVGGAAVALVAVVFAVREKEQQCGAGEQYGDRDNLCVG